MTLKIRLKFLCKDGISFGTVTGSRRKPAKSKFRSASKLIEQNGAPLNTHRWLSTARIKCRQRSSRFKFLKCANENGSVRTRSFEHERQPDQPETIYVAVLVSGLSENNSTRLAKNENGHVCMFHANRLMNITGSLHRTGNTLATLVSACLGQRLLLALAQNLTTSVWRALATLKFQLT